MKILIIKLGATGDVVRTTPLLSQLSGQITWLTAAKNSTLLENLTANLRCFSWDKRANALDTHYDLAINLEDTIDVAQFLRTIECSEIFGAYLSPNGSVTYTESSRRWFDLSLISSYGRERADGLKLLNRQTYQELIFDGLGLPFGGETYLLPHSIETDLSGDVAIAADSGKVWPMKKWPSLIEHLADVRNHRCLVGGDSLPMHFALGTATPCVTLFTCTSPWEIYDYGVQRKIISPLLEEFFYKRGYDKRAATAITVDEVFDAAMHQLETASPKPATVK
jgi:ADP-heptose:LPS heptosyltransferase